MSQNEDDETQQTEIIENILLNNESVRKRVSFPVEIPLFIIMLSMGLAGNYIFD